MIVGQVGNLRGGCLPPPCTRECASGPIDNRPQVDNLHHIIIHHHIGRRVLCRVGILQLTSQNSAVLVDSIRLVRRLRDREAAVVVEVVGLIFELALADPGE